MSAFIPRILASSLDELYVVGGAVRDLLMGRKPKEFDLITTSPLEKIPLKTFAPSNNGMTVGVYYKGVKYDITRYEFLEEDLKRRDFTINSMAIPVEKNGTLKMEKIVDPCGGMKDLEKRVLRTFDAKNLFLDPVRVIRGLRFISEEGFDLDSFTFQAMKKGMEKISSSARERIYPPLEKFIYGKYFEKASEIAKSLNVEKFLSLPTQNFSRVKTIRINVCRWPVIFYKTDLLENFVERVFPPRYIIRHIVRTTYLAREIENKKFTWTMKIKKEEIECVLELLKAFNIPYEMLKEYERTSLDISPVDLQKMGIYGKNIKDVMEKIWKSVLTHQVENEKAQLVKLSKQFIKKLKRE